MGGDERNAVLTAENIKKFREFGLCSKRLARFLASLSDDEQFTKREIDLLIFAGLFTTRLVKFLADAPLEARDEFFARLRQKEPEEERERDEFMRQAWIPAATRLVRRIYRLRKRRAAGERWHLGFEKLLHSLEEKFIYYVENYVRRDEFEIRGWLVRMELGANLGESKIKDIIPPDPHQLGLEFRVVSFPSRRGAP